MKYVFVKDAEGFVSKKEEQEILADDKIISEKEYLKKSGLEFYEKKFNHDEGIASISLSARKGL